MEDEDEHALEGVEGGEQVRHDDRLLVDEEKTECPGEAEEKEQSDRPKSPGPGRNSGQPCSW